MKEELLKEVKDYLRITWNDEDENILKMIDRAVGYFKTITGVEITLVEEENKQLFFDCCRYIYNHAFEEFEQNFLSQIINLQMRTSVEGIDETT